MTTEEQIAMLEAKTRELVERNRKLANQIVGYGDRMQTMIGGVVKDAKVEALREAADGMPVGWGHLIWMDRDTGKVAEGIPATWLRNRADTLEAS